MNKNDVVAKNIVAKSVMSVDPQKWPQITSAVPKTDEIEQRVAELLAQMTVEEKVGQIIQPDINFVTPAEVKKYHLGSVLNGGGSFPHKKKNATVADWVALADEFYEASTDTSDGYLGIPIIWGSDAVHGHNNVIGATIFPHNIGLGAARDPELMHRIAEITAKEVTVTGLDWTFAPTLAVVRDDRWGRTYEGYAESPEIVASYAAPVVEGVQGKYGTDSFMDEAHLLANAKHFLGDGGTFLGKDQGDNRATEEQLRDIHGPGYFEALRAGAQIVMASFSSWNGIKMHGNKGLLTQVLKERMGFDGFIVSDWNAHGQVPGCSVRSCPAALLAGIDMVMVPEDWEAFYHNTLKDVKNGEIPMERLNDAVTRILRVKARAGVLDAPKPSARPLTGKLEYFGSAEHRAVAREAVRKSMVLLKNNNELLPINPTKNILVLGDGANDIGKQSGGWTISWQGTGNTNEDFPNGISIYQGLAEQVEQAGGTIELLDGNKLEYTQKPDVAIMVYGEDPYAEFQGDRNILVYSDRRKRNLKMLEELNKQNIPVVSVFLSGRPLWANPYINRSQAFVAAWLPGSEGTGVADVLLTDANGKVQHDFVGRLSFSWPKLTTQFQLNHDEQPYDPLYAYGYGLSYGDNVMQGTYSEEIDEYAAHVEKSNIVFSNGRSYSPWTMYIEGMHKRGRVVIGMETTSDNDEITARLADRDRQGDSMMLSWNKKAPAAMYLKAGDGQDLSAANITLRMQVNLKKRPKGDVNVELSCGKKCTKQLSLTPYLADLQENSWQQLDIPLSCFTPQDAKLKTIDSIRFESDSPMVMTVSDIRFVEPSHVSCAAK